LRDGVQRAFENPREAEELAVPLLKQQLLSLDPELVAIVIIVILIADRATQITKMLWLRIVSGVSRAGSRLLHHSHILS